MSRTLEDACGLCGQTREWHEEHHPRHGFREEGDSTSLNGGSPTSGLVPETPSEAAKRAVSKLGSDPVLRALLIEKGVISSDDLERVVGQFAEAARLGGAVVVVDGKLLVGALPDTQP